MVQFRSIRVPAVVVAATLVAFLPAWTAPATPTAPVPSANASVQPLVLMLPGRGFNSTDTVSLRRSWIGALNRGIASVTGEPLLSEGDLRLVWYADALGPGTGACPVQDREEDSVGETGERTGAEWAREVGTALRSGGALMGLVAQWVGGAEGEALEALAMDLAYLGDDRRRCGAEERIAGALETAEREGRPVILVAHSFGALVSYHHLQARPDTSPRIERWITVGSLLGHPELREVLLAGGGGTGLPHGVGSWVNVRDPRDPLAARLVGLGSSPGDTVAIEDRTTETPAAGNPHDPERYLADPATARAVVEAWYSLTPPR